MSNSKTRDLFLKFGPEIPNLAKKAGVKLLAGPLVNAEHIITTVVEADKIEATNQFVTESKLEHFNRVRIIPSVPLKEGLEEVAKQHTIFLNDSRAAAVFRDTPFRTRVPAGLDAGRFKIGLQFGVLHEALGFPEEGGLFET